MTDRELLELAAKAAGIELQPMEVKNVSHIGDDRFIGYMVSADKWPRGWFNPLTDDGDALRLAVKLEIDVWHGKWPSGGKYAAAHKVWCPNDSMYYDDGVAHKNDKEAATRRAITRAAAEIGKAMK